LTVSGSDNGEDFKLRDIKVASEPLELTAPAEIKIGLRHSQSPIIQHIEDNKELVINVKFYKNIVKVVLNSETIMLNKAAAIY
jgi:hypothetical protein